MTPKIFEYILVFIYFDEDFVKLSADSLKEEDWVSLLKAAQYLNYNKLQTFCEKIISEEILSSKNVFCFLELSLILNCETLQNNCLMFVANKYNLSLI